MLELDKDRFAQLLREVPEKDVLFPNPQYSPYIQSLIDRLKEEESLDLAAIDWSAFEMADVTIPSFRTTLMTPQGAGSRGLSEGRERLRSFSPDDASSFEVAGCTITNMKTMSCCFCVF